jgi:hypothetical protein
MRVLRREPGILAGFLAAITPPGPQTFLTSPQSPSRVFAWGLWRFRKGQEPLRKMTGDIAGIAPPFLSRLEPIGFIGKDIYFSLYVFLCFDRLCMQESNGIIRSTIN